MSLKTISVPVSLYSTFNIKRFRNLCKIGFCSSYDLLIQINSLNSGTRNNRLQRYRRFFNTTLWISTSLSSVVVTAVNPEYSSFIKCRHEFSCPLLGRCLVPNSLDIEVFHNDSNMDFIHFSHAK